MSVDTVIDWDPVGRKDEEEVVSPLCLLRLKRDLKSLSTNPPHGIFTFVDEDDMRNIHTLIIGPDGTPYERGFFYFFLRIPPDYPMSPPRVRFMTTDGGKTRFNPNLYKNGKVCLSILGTWEGPSWSVGATLTSVLVSIQSLLGEKPYFNEPGYDKERKPGDVDKFNDVIKHETMRVAVAGMLRSTSTLALPIMMVLKIQETFLQYYDHYKSVCEKMMHQDDKPMEDPFKWNLCCFKYQKILHELENIRAELVG